MVPLLYIGVPVRLSKSTYIEFYNGNDLKYFAGCVERFIELNGVKIDKPFSIGETEMLRKQLIIK